MIGWRVGWVTGSQPIMKDVSLVGLTSVICKVGIAQQAVAAVLRHPGAAVFLGPSAGSRVASGDVQERVDGCRQAGDDREQHGNRQAGGGMDGGQRAE
jgi:DNA-binding transcriptional MocR family regulator